MSSQVVLRAPLRRERVSLWSLDRQNLYGQERSQETYRARRVVFVKVLPTTNAHSARHSSSAASIAKITIFIIARPSPKRMTTMTTKMMMATMKKMRKRTSPPPVGPMATAVAAIAPHLGQTARLKRRETELNPKDHPERKR